MAEITTQDCKNFLINRFSKTGTVTTDKEWKRTSKYKQNNFWIRDFFHLTLGTVSLKENNGNLEIVPTVAKQTEQSPSFFKTFSSDEVAGAKKLMQQLIKIRSKDRYTYAYDENPEEKFMQSDEWKKYQHALPSQFTFHFPSDSDGEIYNNSFENVTKGLDTPLIKKNKYNDTDSFNIIFNDKNTNDIDLYTSDCLRHDASGVLPFWTSFVDEYHLEADDYEVEGETLQTMTVKDFVNMLFDLGFQYKVPVGKVCLFGKEMKQYMRELKNNF